MERTEHLKRFRGAALFLLVIHAFALATGGVQLLSGNSGGVFDGGSMVAAALIIIVPALMVWNGSVLGAFVLILLWGSELIISLVDGSQFGWSQIRSVLYLGLSVWLLRELILYRRKSRRDDVPIGGSAIVRWGGIGVVGVMAGLFALGLAHTFVSSSPAKGLLTARQIPGEQYRWMYDNDILGNAERVFYYSSDIGKDYADGGKVLTDQFVGGWWRKDDGKLDSGWIKLGEICKVEETQTLDDVEETLYTIYTHGDDSWLRILLPKEDRADREFLARMNYLNDQKMHREVRSACDQNRDPNWDEIAAANGIERDIVGPEDVDADHLTWLRHNEFLTHKETVLKFYSSGNYSIASGGLLLTDAYFGGWAEDTDGLQGWWFRLGKICSIKKKKNATKTNGPVYKVESVDNWFQFNIPDDGGQDLAFINLIEAMNAEARTTETGAACEAMLKEKGEDPAEEIEDPESD